jgi:hypothetical protein
MKQLGLIEFNKQPNGCQHIATYTNINGIYADYGLNTSIYIFIYEQHVIFNRSSKSNQIEVPLGAIKWLIDSIQKFITPEDKGGLPKDQNWIKDTIDEEELFIRYGVNTGGEFREGLTIKNISRQDYIVIKFEEHQSQALTYDLLFKCGLFNLLKQLADKLEI